CVRADYGNSLDFW
nr:immunoglobulin heavy chain junction region [Macaca mulatta]MOW78601.1 immunoglobulin heavy chain junction region [Macaca mulatta]MOW81775.1 immunoglobulin heavy chain junction region [Macaca mulatta]MOW82242.1 immunoglobulin heavy chain junction region [Macaca mulatta]MOW82592.1 immunoglobulin heavy chain junction region [Macaca mulatta]